jgi:hypothetical protein
MVPLHCQTRCLGKASLTGKVRYELKTPYRNGTTHVILNRWILLRVWLPLCPSPGSISPDFTVCSRPTANTVFMSRQLSEGNEERKKGNSPESALE